MRPSLTTSPSIAHLDRNRAAIALEGLGVQNIRPLNSNSVHRDDAFGTTFRSAALTRLRSQAAAELRETNMDQASQGRRQCREAVSRDT